MSKFGANRFPATFVPLTIVNAGLGGPAYENVGGRANPATRKGRCIAPTVPL